MFDTILFDLDGTIVDTNELIIRSFLHTLEGLTPEPLSRDYISINMGKPLVEQLRQFSGRTEVADLIQVYREFNIRKHDELVTEFPHVRDVLGQLHAAGIRLGIVTSKARVTTEMGLKLCGLREYMSAIVTIDDVEQSKPHPEPVLKALALLGSDPQGTLMVGDSHYDILAGQAAGVRTAGVAWSLKGEDFLRSHRPDYLLHDMRELLTIAGVRAE